MNYLQKYLLFKRPQFDAKINELKNRIFKSGSWDFNFDGLGFSRKNCRLKCNRIKIWFSNWVKKKSSCTGS